MRKGGRNSFDDDGVVLYIFGQMLLRSGKYVLGGTSSSTYIPVQLRSPELELAQTFYLRVKVLSKPPRDWGLSHI